MSNLLKLLMGVSFLSVLLVSCGDDKDSSKNYIKYDGSEYELSFGVLENYGLTTNGEGYDMNLVLMSSGLKTHEIDGQIDSLSGVGHLIYFALSSETSDRLAIGEYSFIENDNYQPFTIGLTGVLLNHDYDSQAEESGTSLAIDNGQLSVKKVGNEYELSFSCIDKDGKSVTVYYKGSLKYYDVSADAKLAIEKKQARKNVKFGIR